MVLVLVYFWFRKTYFEKKIFEIQKKFKIFENSNLFNFGHNKPNKPKMWSWQLRCLNKPKVTKIWFRINHSHFWSMLNIEKFKKMAFEKTWKFDQKEVDNFKIFSFLQNMENFVQHISISAKNLKKPRNSINFSKKLKTNFLDSVENLYWKALRLRLR